MAKNKSQETDVKPPVAANGVSPAATDEAYVANNQVNPALTPAENKAHEQEETAEKTKEHLEGAKAVDTKLGTSKEEKAAERAGVREEGLNNPKQNREPRNQFEKDNQAVTETERKAAQKVSDMSASEKEKKSEAPKDEARTDAAKTAETNQAVDVAKAVAGALKDDKKFELGADEGVEHRFSRVKDKDTGEIMIRDNTDGTISRIQLESLEEKEASLNERDVEEV